MYVHTWIDRSMRKLLQETTLIKSLNNHRTKEHLDLRVFYEINLINDYFEYHGNSTLNRHN